MMSESEFIIWKCETRDEIKEKYPEWNDEQVETFLRKLINKLAERKLIPE